MKLEIKTENLLYQMLRIRLIEEAIADEYKKQEIRCPVHLSIGQEAIPVGISAVLSQSDKVVSAHRSHAHYLAKGGNLKELLSEIYGKRTGCAAGKGGSMHLFDLRVGLVAAVPIVGSSISIGTGVGWSLKLKNTSNVVVIYFGDGATEEGSFSESLNFAKLHDLPIIFVCENNLYSVYTHIGKRQHKDRDICNIVEAHGIKTFSGDGNNVLEVCDLAFKARSEIIKESGPVFLNFSTYRWLEHCGPNYDNHLKYREPNEVKAWTKRCPIELLKDGCKSGELKEKISFDEMVSKIKNEVNEAINYAKNSAFPEETDLFKDIYQ